VSSSASERIAWAVESLEVGPSDRILEIGCGHGVAVSLICERLEAGSVVAIDRSAKMIEAATKRNADQVADGRASFVCAPFADADLGDARFDRVLAIHVGTFERRQPALELDKIAEHLAEGGRLHLSYQPLAAGGAVQTAARLSETLQRHGFAVESVVSKDLAGGRTVCVIATPE